MRENTIPELDPVDSTPTNPTVPTTLPPTVAPDLVDSTPTTAMTPERTDPWEKLTELYRQLECDEFAGHGRKKLADYKVHSL